jgi:hypothetical protein
MIDHPAEEFKRIIARGRKFHFLGPSGAAFSIPGVSLPWMNHALVPGRLFG